MAGMSENDRYVHARGWSLLLLDAVGADAIVMPWRVCYIRASCADDDRLRAHEREHFRQIEQDGAAKFSLLYLWYGLRYGYRANPYEIAARINCREQICTARDLREPRIARLVRRMS